MIKLIYYIVPYDIFSKYFVIYKLKNDNYNFVKIKIQKINVNTLKY